MSFAATRFPGSLWVSLRTFCSCATFVVLLLWIVPNPRPPPTSHWLWPVVDVYKGAYLRFHCWCWHWPWAALNGLRSFLRVPFVVDGCSVFLRFTTFSISTSHIPSRTSSLSSLNCFSQQHQLFSHIPVQTDVRTDGSMDVARDWYATVVKVV